MSSLNKVIINISSAIYAEIMSEKIKEKQGQIIDQINKKLDKIHERRKTGLYLGFESDAKAAEMYEKLIKLREKCFNTEEFGLLAIEYIERHGLKYE